MLKRWNLPNFWSILYMLMSTILFWNELSNMYFIFSDFIFSDVNRDNIQYTNLDTNACENKPCLNGGTCTPTGTGSTFICSCNSGYSGTYCQICKPSKPFTFNDKNIFP